MYLGLSPYDAPATYSLLQYTELAEGVWYPMGGMYAGIQALVKIAEKLGVKFIYNAPVKRIEGCKDQKLIGVELARWPRIHCRYFRRQRRPALHLQATAPRPQPKRRNYRRQTLYLLHDHVLLGRGQGISSRSRITMYSSAAITKPRSIKSSTTTPCLKCHRSMSMRPRAPIHAAAPEGTGHVICARARRSSRCAHRTGLGCAGQPRPRNRVRPVSPKRWAQPTSREHIKFEIVYQPKMWKERFNLEKGSAFGLSHNFWQVGYLRPHNRHKQYKNLYFAGASTHPGTGLPIVLLSARLTTERILKEVGTISVQNDAINPS